MPRRLLIRIDAAGHTTWLALSRDGRALHGAQDGWPAPGDVEQATLIAPAESVLLLPAPALPGSRRQREQALPFAIEDQLAAPVEQSHVVLGEGAAADVVAVVARDDLQRWLDAARAAGIEPDRVLPEAWLLLEPDSDAATGAVALCEGARALLRHARAGAIVCAATELPEWIAITRGDAAAATQLIVAGEAREPALPHAQVQRTGDALSWLAQRLPTVAPLDLLRGAYAPRRRTGAARRQWRIAAALLVAAVLCAFAFAIGERIALERRLERTTHVMESLYRDVEPDAQRIVDPAAQLRSLAQRQGGGTAGGPLDLLARTAPVLASGTIYTLDAIDYRGGALEITLRAPDVAALDALRERIAALSLEVELTAATPGSGVVEGRLRVRARSAA